mmetsp:Transcript_9880/g.24346  ORF Transcript_9880/g.24346 Transcript_9880/m.24346 type:complete len:298 (-) Transcript_9880:1760-2653(-)
MARVPQRGLLPEQPQVLPARLLPLLQPRVRPAAVPPLDLVELLERRPVPHLDVSAVGARQKRLVVRQDYAEPAVAAVEVALQGRLWPGRLGMGRLVQASKPCSPRRGGGGGKLGLPALHAPQPEELIQVPDPHCRVGSCGDERCAVGGKGERADLPRVAPQGAGRALLVLPALEAQAPLDGPRVPQYRPLGLPRPQVPHVDRPLRGAHREVRVVVRDGQASDAVTCLVAAPVRRADGKRAPLPHRPWVPHLDPAVQAGRREQRTVGRQVDKAHRAGVRLRLGGVLEGLWVPHHDSPV